MRSPIFASGVLLLCAAYACFWQVILTPRNSNGLYQAEEKAALTVKPAADSKTTKATDSVRKNSTTHGVQQGAAPPVEGLDANSLSCFDISAIL